MYEVKTNNFSGAMEKLLELIEEKKMDITTVNLSEVTGDFLAHLSRLKKLEDSGENIERLIADFIVVAARLILIKSKTLLPELKLSEEDEAEMKDFELRLRVYKEMREAAKLFSDLWQRKERGFARELFLNRPAIFHPSKQLKAEELFLILKQVVEGIKTEIKEEKREKSKMVTIEEKMSEMLLKVKEGLVSFLKMSKGRGKSEVVALFLAILHLIRDRLIIAEQSDNFSDVIIKKS